MTFAKKIREASKVPIIFLTAADEETDIIMGLDIGGDDYITKPFKLSVLMSRINAALCRSGGFRNDTELSSNGITIKLLKGEVYKNGERIDLTAGEYRLLCMFMKNPDIVLSSEQILGRLWDCDEKYVDSNTRVYSPSAYKGKNEYFLHHIDIFVSQRFNKYMIRF